MLATRMNSMATVAAFAFGLTACGEMTVPGDTRGGDVVDASDGGDATMDAGMEAGCAAGQMLCNGACINTQTDNGNCGACRMTCPAGVGCVAGTCSCPAGRSVCDNQCVDTQTNAMHCGMCGRACASGMACAFGMCVAECAAPRMLCRDAMGMVSCADLNSDPTNCGICGARCGTGYVCSMGRCVCSSPRMQCGTACADLQTSADHCGMCGFSCGPGGTCMAGMCRCGAGATVCTGRCVDLMTDTTHCGACNNLCFMGQSCVAGRCVCAGGRTGCGAVCTDLMTDTGHCGMCGNACAVGATCTTGMCACPMGQTACSGACVDRMTDVRNCGTCGNACPPTTACVSGVCRCPGTMTACSGRCTDTQTDVNNCGACANSCGPGGACAAGRCTCAMGYTLCAGACVDTRYSSAHCGGCGRACPGTMSCSSGVCVADPTFRLATVSNTGCVLSASVEPTAGDQRGLVAMTSTNVLYTGDLTTVRLSNLDLTGITGVGRQHDAMVSDLRSQTAYVLLDAAGNEPASGAAVSITQLGQLDPNGALTAGRIPLSRAIALSGFSGIGFFSGFGRLLIWVPTGADMGWWNVTLPAGVVTRLTGTLAPQSPMTCESWALAGIAEFFGGEYYAVFTTFSAPVGVVRQRVRDGVRTSLMTTTSIGDICAITFSTSRNRWYFQYEATPTFAPPPAGMFGEFVGYCPATWDAP